jgi:hypothetical protein
MTEAEIANLKAFAKELIKLSWNGCPDGADVQALAEQHCLIVPVIYDPAAHGDHVEAVPGEDTIYVFSDWLKDG